jgi:hypothetical protein
MINKHSFYAANQCTTGADCKDCNSFNSCHTNSQDGHCSEFHDPCPEGFAAASAAKEALKAGGTALFLVARTNPKHVRIVAANYVVVMDCAGKAVIMAKRLPKGNEARRASSVRRVTSVAGAAFRLSFIA